MTTKRVNIRISNLPARQKRGWTAAVRKMLESGSHATIAEIATAEKINASYVGRVLAADPAISATKYIAVSLGVGTETFGRESDGVPAPRACGST